MKYPSCFGIVVCLGGVFLVAQTNSPSTEPKQQGPPSNIYTQEPKQTPFGGIEVLSDTAGVDFDPYLHPALKAVRKNWYNLAPPSARAPRMMRGEVSIEFAILKTGKVSGMKRVATSGDVSLDHAAWNAIADSRFPPLPAEYTGQILPCVSISFTTPTNRAT